jgi:flagellar secretion chaperone FliS
MFATVAPGKNAGTFNAKAYRQVGLETGVDAASPHQLVLMLIDGFQDALAQARGAIASHDIETKGRAIGRAVRIIEEGLRAGLNQDAGGSLAGSLDALYRYITVRLTQANSANDIAALEECTRLMEPVRAAWAAIGAQVGAHG